MLFQPERSSGLVNSTSIVVCTVDRPSDLEDCLKSLGPFRGVGAEVIVVNNGPRGALVEQIAQRHAARVVLEPERGVSRARNAGIRAAQGSILAFLDDDSVADPNWLPLLVAPFHDVGVLAVAGSIQSQTLADPVSETFDYLHRAQFPESQLIVDGNAERRTFPMRSALVGNANMAIRREAFDRFGYFDTRLGRGTRIGSGEEPDLLLRILLGGAKIAVEPTARIQHRHSTERRALRRWAFQSGCAHTAILTKHFVQEPSLRGQILHYAASRLRPQSASEASAAKELNLPRISLLLGSLFGPLAFLLAGKEKQRVSPRG
jgi:GT2 family glycosyltransferase